MPQSNSLTKVYREGNTGYPGLWQANSIVDEEVEESPEHKLGMKNVKLRKGNQGYGKYQGLWIGKGVTLPKELELLELKTKDNAIS